MYLFKLTFIAITSLSCAFLSIQAQVPKYNVTLLIDRATYPNITIENAAINDKAEVLLNWLDDTGSTIKNKEGNALIYPNSTMIDLTQSEPIPGIVCSLMSLNDHLEFAGNCATPAGATYVVGYTLSGGLVKLGDKFSVGSAINNAGQIAGSSSFVPDNPQRAAVFLKNGTIVDLGSFDGPQAESVAYAINNRYATNGLGQVVGINFPPSGYLPNRAFLYDNGKLINIGQIVCPDKGSGAQGINDKGQIIGSCEGNSWFVYYANTGDYSFSNSSVSPDYINNSGWIVASGLESEAYYLITNIQEGLHNLLDLVPSDSGITVILAVHDLNNRGQILADTNIGLVLLTPA